MNVSALLTLYILNSQSQSVSDDINIQVANSVFYVINNHFMKYSSSFVFILFCQRQHTWFYFRDLMEDLFGYLNDAKVQIVMNDTNAGNIGDGERNFNLVFVDSADSFINNDLASKVKNYDNNEYYFVYVQNRDKFLQKDMKRIFEYCWKHYLINVTILIQKATGEIIIYTYFPFNELECDNVDPVEINRYRNGKMDRNEIFPEKLSNMHRCPVKVGLLDLAPFIYVDTDKHGTNAICGFEGELLKALSKSMNFEIDYMILKNGERGVILPNGTTGALRMLQNRELDISLGFYSYTTARTALLTPTYTYYQSREVFVILKESPNYRTPQMIYYPFSTTIWICLLPMCLMVLCILFGMVSYARRQNMLLISQNYLTIQFIAITLGMTSMLNPKRLFGRLFIATWMMCTLVIRAQYQARIFHLIRNNFFGDPPRSTEELVNEGYTFVMNYVNYNATPTSLYMKDISFNLKPLENSDHLSMCGYLEEHPDEKLVVMEPNEIFLHFGAQNRKAEVFESLSEVMVVQSVCMYLTKHSFLSNRINGLVRWMDASGLMNSWVNKALHLSYFRAPLEHKQTTIGMNQLKVAFYLCGLLLAVSVIVFLLEVMSVRLRILRKLFK